MKAKLLNDDREKTLLLIYDTGDEVIAGLDGVREGAQAAIGALHRHRGLQRRCARVLRLAEQDIPGDPAFGAGRGVDAGRRYRVEEGRRAGGACRHVVVGRSDGSTRGGHRSGPMSARRWNWCWSNTRSTWNGSTTRIGPALIRV